MSIREIPAAAITDAVEALCIEAVSYTHLVSFHLEMDAKDDVMHSHDVIDRIERDLLVEDGLIATIHFDPVVTCLLYTSRCV